MFGNRTHRVRLLSHNQKTLTAETSASRFRILCLPKLSGTYLFNHFVPALLAQFSIRQDFSCSHTPRHTMWGLDNQFLARSQSIFANNPYTLAAIIWTIAPHCCAFWMHFTGFRWLQVLQWTYSRHNRIQMYTSFLGRKSIKKLPAMKKLPLPFWQREVCSGRIIVVSDPRLPLL